MCQHWPEHEQPHKGLCSNLSCCTLGVVGKECPECGGVFTSPFEEEKAPVAAKPQAENNNIYPATQHAG